MVPGDNPVKGKARSAGGGSQTLRRGRLPWLGPAQALRPRAGKAWATIAVVIALLLTLGLGSGPGLTPIASADGKHAKFEATAAVIDFGLKGGTVSSFHTNRQGKIKLLKVDTFGERIQSGGIVITECDDDPRAQEFCSSVSGAGILSLHNSSVIMPDPEIIANTLGPGKDLLAGRLKGRLESDFSISNRDGQLKGTARLMIRGSGAYGCFSLILVDPRAGTVVPFPEALGVCQGIQSPDPSAPGPAVASPMLLPTFLNVEDNGRFKIRQASGVFEGIKQVKGKVNVTLAFTAQPRNFDGAIAITKGKVSFLEKDEEKDEWEDDDGD